jgi:hypothetical protein
MADVRIPICVVCGADLPRRGAGCRTCAADRGVAAAAGTRRAGTSAAVALAIGAVVGLGTLAVSADGSADVSRAARAAGSASPTDDPTRGRPPAPGGTADGSTADERPAGSSATATSDETASAGTGDQVAAAGPVPATGDGSSSATTDPQTSPTGATPTTPNTTAPGSPTTTVRRHADDRRAPAGSSAPTADAPTGGIADTTPVTDPTPATATTAGAASTATTSPATSPATTAAPATTHAPTTSRPPVATTTTDPPTTTTDRRQPLFEALPEDLAALAEQVPVARERTSSPVPAIIRTISLASMRQDLVALAVEQQQRRLASPPATSQPADWVAKVTTPATIALRPDADAHRDRTTEAVAHQHHLLGTGAADGQLHRRCQSTQHSVEVVRPAVADAQHRPPHGRPTPRRAGGTDPRPARAGRPSHRRQSTSAAGVHRVRRTARATAA